jgi:hypothetical protein
MQNVGMIGQLELLEVHKHLADALITLSALVGKRDETELLPIMRYVTAAQDELMQLTQKIRKDGENSSSE